LRVWERELTALVGRSAASPTGQVMFCLFGSDIRRIRRWETRDQESDTRDAITEITWATTAIEIGIQSASLGRSLPLTGPVLFVVWRTDRQNVDLQHQLWSRLHEALEESQHRGVGILV